MPRRIHIEFPATPSGLPALDFVCESGDFDCDADLDKAMKSILKRLAPNRPSYPAARTSTELT